MPTLNQHAKFIISKPYSKWYIIYYNDKKAGSVYLSRHNEIGIHIKKNMPKTIIFFSSLKILIKKNPRKQFLANISPSNIYYQNLFKKFGFKIIQYTFEKIK